MKSYSANKDQIKLSVEVPTEPVALAAFTFSITVTNHSSVPCEMIQISSVPYYLISVFTEDGRECERTPKGDSINGPNSLGGFQTKIIVIAPGKAHTWKILLKDLFVLQPGKYKMTVESRNHRKKVDGIEFSIQR